MDIRLIGFFLLPICCGAPALPSPDGDGVEEMLVFRDFNVNVETMLYIMKGSCGYAVGEFIEEGVPEIVLPTRVNGLADLKVISASTVPRIPPRLRVHRFNKGRYRVNRNDEGAISMTSSR